MMTCFCGIDGQAGVGNDHFFRNLSMPAGQATLEPAERIETSSLVTVTARDGTDFGIRLASMQERWFTAPAGMVEGLCFPGFTSADASSDIGDSTITETAGHGSFAMAAAPAITQSSAEPPARRWPLRWRCMTSPSMSTMASPSPRWISEAHRWGLMSAW